MGSKRAPSSFGIHKDSGGKSGYRLELFAIASSPAWACIFGMLQRNEIMDERNEASSSALQHSFVEALSLKATGGKVKIGMRRKSAPKCWLRTEQEARHCGTAPSTPNCLALAFTLPALGRQIQEIDGSRLWQPAMKAAWMGPGEGKTLGH